LLAAASTLRLRRNVDVGTLSLQSSLPGEAGDAAAWCRSPNGEALAGHALMPSAKV
jgi:hypothetical protein